MEREPSLKMHPACFLRQQTWVKGSVLEIELALEQEQAQGQQQGWTMALPQLQGWSWQVLEQEPSPKMHPACFLRQ
jgi:hypothetical protein